MVNFDLVIRGLWGFGVMVVLSRGSGSQMMGFALVVKRCKVIIK